MTTATQPKPQTPAPTRAAPTPVSASGVAPVDPIKLLKQHAALLVACGIGGAVLGAAYHFAQMALWPVYKSQVIYQCTTPVANLTKTDLSQYSQDEFDRFMGTQAALMTSETVLQAAAKDPDVMLTSWAKTFVNSKGEYQAMEAALRLEDRLTAKVAPMTNLIRLTCTWKNGSEAATIVNAVNRAYLEDFRRSVSTETSDRREALGRRLQDIRESIKLLTGQRETLISTSGLDAAGNNADGLIVEIQGLTAKRAEEAARAANLQSILDGYKAAVSNAGTVVYPDRVREEALADPMIREMDRDLADLRSREQAFLMQGMGENHPDVKAVKTLIDSKQRQRQTAFESALQKIFNGLMDQTRMSLDGAANSVATLDQRILETRKKREQMLSAKLQIDLWKDQIDDYRISFAATEQAVKELETQGSLKEGNRVRVIRSGMTPNEVTFPKLFITVPGGMVLVPLLVGGVLFLRELLDQRVRGPADLSLIPRLRLLGIIPDASEDPARPANMALAFRDAPSSVITESLRQIRAPLAKKLEQSGHKSLLVIPGMPGSGGTSIACNLALANAATDRRVLIIDANFRRPGLHKVFGAADGPGLGDILANQADLASAAQASNIPNLSVLSAGSAATRALPERLSTEAMARLIREASEAYDLVVVDAPPAIVSGDGLVLANRCDAVCLVVRALQEKRGLVARLQSQLSDCRGEFLGVIVNGVRSSAGGYFKRNIKATHEYQKAKA